MAGKIGQVKRAPLPEQSGQQRIWSAMRVLRKFTQADIVATSEASAEQVKRYTRALVSGQYLRIVKARASGMTGGHAQYQLVRDSGPLAPRDRQRAGGLIDPNLDPQARRANDQFIQVPRKDYERALLCARACAGMTDDELRAKAGGGVMNAEAINVIAARAAWGAEIPDWVLLLAEQCDVSSQKSAAKAMGYSPTVANQVVLNRYTGDLRAVEGAVRGAFQNATVECPILGETPRQQCLVHQRTPFAITNPQRVQLYRACRSGCPHSRLPKSE